MKLRAARQGRKLRDVAAEIVRRGLAEAPKGAKRHRVRLPLIQCGCPPASIRELTPDEVAGVLLRQEAEWSHGAARR